MFIAFEGSPRIVRLFGTGSSKLVKSYWVCTVVVITTLSGKFYEYGTPEYNEYIPIATRKPGSRAAIVIDVHKVGSVSNEIYRPPASDSGATEIAIVMWIHHSLLRLQGRSNNVARIYDPVRKCRCRL